MTFPIALLAIIAVCLGVMCLFGVWISGRIEAAWAKPQVAVDPIVGPRDRIAVYDTGRSHIPMPERLKTHEEMVAWMTKELPKLVAESGRSGV